VASWLAFCSSLMLFAPDEFVLSLAVILGVVSIFDVMHLLHRLFTRWIQEFSCQYCLLRFYNRFVYYTSMGALWGLLLAGFSITTSLSELSKQDPGFLAAVSDGPVPRSDVVGFITGWILSAVTVGVVLFLFCHFQLFLRIGMLRWRDSGYDKRLSRVDPTEVLATTNPRFAL
jgi:hypothetical protein